MEKLIGKKINKIFINDDYLKFQTDQGDVCFKVEGDCCSQSYFYDFIGVEKLLKNGQITKVETINLEEAKLKHEEDVIQCYGYRVTTESEEFGEMDAVLSFRNSSNGYYGGWMEECVGIPSDEKLQEITQDWVNPES